MKKTTKIIASLAATFVLIASIATVSLFKSDDSQVVPTTLPTVSTTFPVQQPVETVSAFDWDAYINSLDLSTEPESSTINPSDPTATVPSTSPNVVISIVYPSDYVPQTLPASTTTKPVTTSQADRVEMVDYKYTVNTEDDSVTLTKYIGSDLTPSIPETVNGRNVTTIGNSCFKSSKITAVYIPKTVTSISTAAFNNCQKLKNVYFLGTNYVDIGESVFENCISLENVYLSANTTSIGANAFANCTALKKLKIPESVTVIGANAFAGCTEGFTIVCKSGTEAETYALGHNIVPEIE